MMMGPNRDIKTKIRRGETPESDTLLVHVNSDDVSEFICTKSVSLYGVLKIHPLVPLHLKASVATGTVRAARKEGHGWPPRGDNENRTTKPHRILYCNFWKGKGSMLGGGALRWGLRRWPQSISTLSRGGGSSNPGRARRA
ncbi:hypothetical protein THAOC_29933 [Thalassiosira oceanica]|uniref:Uncharacterized protein n=1 Tax=Thalassiosira oceanica TaxID=159749 RepID=K0RCK8_THAOC|nr:hypothetical protein THAOC_29933 [Thalassiosira oceanica]|eukprot:EJK50950.1 hypothetical protein THAOC_29933 [Thalassiosira oceanica]